MSSLLLSLLSAALLGSGSNPAPAPPSPPMRYTGSAVVTYTFDDGPNPENTPKVLEVLRDHNQKKAIFFLTGQNAQKYPELVDQIVAEGHTLGAHSWKHDNLTKMTAAQVKEDFDATLAAIRYPVTYFRAPYGAWSEDSLREAQEHGLISMGWSVETLDWKGDEDAAVAAGLAAKPGEIVILHDVNPGTSEVILRILEGH